MKQRLLAPGLSVLLAMSLVPAALAAPGAAAEPAPGGKRIGQKRRRPA